MALPLLAAPASCLCARATALYAVCQMRGLNSWGNNSAEVFSKKPQGIFQPDQPSEQVCFKAVLAECKRWHRAERRGGQGAQLSLQCTHRGNPGVPQPQNESQFLWETNASLMHMGMKFKAELQTKSLFSQILNNDS